MKIKISFYKFFTTNINFIYTRSIINMVVKEFSSDLTDKQLVKHDV